MGSLVIVVPQPSGEYSLATGGGLVGFSVGPFALQRLDEALRFAIGGPKRPSSMPKTTTGRLEPAEARCGRHSPLFSST